MIEEQTLAIPPQAARPMTASNHTQTYTSLMDVAQVPAAGATATTSQQVPHRPFQSRNEISTAGWLRDGGIMGARVRHHDWASTSLGPIATWPQSLKSLVNLVLAAPLPMNLLWGPELIQIYNDAYAPLMGLKHPAGLGQPAAECWQEVWEVAGPLYERVFAGEPVVLENSQWILNRHGVPEAAWLDNYLTPVLDENGAVGGAHVIAFETIGRVRAAVERDRSEQPLRASEQRLQRVLETDAVGIIFFDHSGTVVDANGVFLNMTGYTRAEVGRHELTWRRLTPAKWVGISEEQMKKLAATGRIGPYEKEYILKDGSCRWMLFAGRDLGDGTIAKYCLDITARKQAETALRQSEARLQAAIDLVGLSPYTWNPATGALDLDARLKAMWGLPPDAHVDHEVWLSGIHPEDRAQVDAALAHCLDPTGDGVYHIDYRVIGIGDGVERWVSSHGRTTFENGQPVGLTGAALEITERKRAEATLRESEVRLAAILDQLPVGVGLADPEGTITMGNQVLQQYAMDKIPSRDPMRAQRWRANTPDGQPLSPSDYPCAQALRGETPVSGTDFVFTFPDGREAWTRVTAAPFHNAAQEIAGATLVVQDIDREKRAEERFREFADHSSDVLWIVNARDRTLEYLSLAFETVFGIARDLFMQDRIRWAEVVLPDDRVSVTEAFDRAALGEVFTQEFRIVRSDGAVRWLRNTFFPMRDAQGRIRRVGGIAQDITRYDGHFVYVVDADEASRQDLTRGLRDAGYDVRVFPSGKAFLEAAPALAAGCVVLAIRQPDAGGLTIPRELKARRIGLPVIVVGDAQGDITFAVQVMKAGAVDFLPIPYGLDQLLAAVASAAADIRRTKEDDNQASWARARIAAMPVREREVLEGLLAGQTNKQIGQDIGISPRTVETHRAHVMQRLGARTIPELVRIAASAGVHARPQVSRAKGSDEP